MDGIIFDVDGTIWDATEVVAESWNAAIKKHTDLDIHVTKEILADLFGKTMEEICQILFPLLGEEEMFRIGNYCFEYENELLESKHGVLYTGMRETIETLAKEYPLYIVSNCQCGYIEVMLKTQKLGHYFKDHLCYGETKQPKSYTIRKIMERNNLKDVIYIGDTMGDATACKEVGIPFVFTTYGFGQVADAKWSIDAPLELLDVILKMNHAK
ncbi:MAG: HAD family hydrolase [Lachnospiraceae bacterium]|nr:HAD family hydrolase [Lachnospiraceae bacterium]